MCVSKRERGLKIAEPFTVLGLESIFSLKKIIQWSFKLVHASIV